MQNVRGLKRKRYRGGLEDSDGDEEDDRFNVGEAGSLGSVSDKPPSMDKTPRVRTRKSKAQGSAPEDSNVAAVVNACTQMKSELLAVMRSATNRASCHKCGGSHFVRSCPELLQQDGSFAKYCNYCQKTGHSVGPPSTPECPVLQNTKCPTCGIMGHTLDYCPRNTCAACNTKGHTSKVCRERKPGIYALSQDSALNF